MVTKHIGDKAITIDDKERQECEIWSRVMGYYRPVSEFNIGKKSEHHARTFFVENVVMNHLSVGSNAVV